MNNNLEELITALYDMIQDAKSVPLSSDKCIIERDKALDMLDDLSAQLPAELKQARTIVQSREELVSQARREAENIIRNAHTEAEKLIEHEVIYQQTLAKCQEMAKANMAECDERIRKTEETMAQIRQLRLRGQLPAPDRGDDPEGSGRGPRHPRQVPEHHQARQPRVRQYPVRPGAVIQQVLQKRSRFRDRFQRVE